MRPAQAVGAACSGHEFERRKPVLTDKDAVASEFEEAVRRRAGELGLEIVSVGIRDVILPGEMKDLMNKVTEAKKAAEANLIVRREETAAMRSQANTAKLLADNPTLMRLRELEVLEKVATSGKLNVVLGEEGPGRPRGQPVVDDDDDRRPGASRSSDFLQAASSWASSPLGDGELKFCSPWGAVFASRSICGVRGGVGG